MNCRTDLIINPRRASQVLDYAGMLPPPCSPTDIDGLIEWKDRAYIVIECKHNKVDMQTGQRLAVERMVKDFQRAGKDACAILVKHSVDDTQASVYVADFPVKLVFNGKGWRKPKSAILAGEFVRATLKYFDKEGSNVGGSLDKDSHRHI